MTYFWTNILRYLHIVTLCVALISLSQPAAAMGGNSHDMTAPEITTEMVMTPTMASHCDSDESEPDTSDKSCCSSCDLSGACDTSCMGMSATLGHILDLSVKGRPQSLKDHFINHMIAVVLTSDLPPPQA